MKSNLQYQRADNRSQKTDVRVQRSEVRFLPSAICYLLSVICLLLSVICFLSAGCTNLFHKNKFVIAGTSVEVVSPDNRAPGIVYEEFKRLDKIFNSNDPSSEISRLNATYNTSFKVSAPLLEVLKLSVQVNEMTDGAFDVSCTALNTFWKDLTKKSKIIILPRDEEINRLKENCGMHNIEIDPNQSTVTIKRKGLKIDLAPIAKGYMVDIAVLKLKQAGIKSAAIKAGDNVYCLGTNKAAPWNIKAKEFKELSAIIETEALNDEAVATCFGYERYFIPDNKLYSSFIDPKTGYPAKNNVLRVSVITKNSTTASSLAAAFCVLGQDGINKFIAKYHSTMRIFVVTDEKGAKKIYIFK